MLPDWLVLILIVAGLALAFVLGWWSRELQEERNLRSYRRVWKTRGDPTPRPEHYYQRGRVLDDVQAGDLLVEEDLGGFNCAGKYVPPRGPRPR